MSEKEKQASTLYVDAARMAYALAQGGTFNSEAMAKIFAVMMNAGLPMEGTATADFADANLPLSQNGTLFEYLLTCKIDGGYALPNEFFIKLFNEIDDIQILQKGSKPALLLAFGAQDRGAVAQALEGKGCRLNVEDYKTDQHSGLYNCIEKGRVDLALHFIDQGAPLEEGKDNLAVQFAVKTGSVELVTRLLAIVGKNISSFTTDLVKVAYQHNQKAMLQHLLKSGAPCPDALLQWAYADKKLEMAKILIQHGSSNIFDHMEEKTGRQALWFAIEAGDQAGAMQILSKTTNPALTDLTTQWHLSVRAFSKEMTTLEEALTEKNPMKSTAVHLIIQNRTLYSELLNAARGDARYGTAQDAKQKTPYDDDSYMGRAAAALMPTENTQVNPLVFE